MKLLAWNIKWCLLYLLYYFVKVVKCFFLYLCFLAHTLLISTFFYHFHEHHHLLFWLNWQAEEHSWDRIVYSESASLYIHLLIINLNWSIRFYTALFPVSFFVISTLMTIPWSYWYLICLYCSVISKSLENLHRDDTKSWQIIKNEYIKKLKTIETMIECISALVVCTAHNFISLVLEI